MMKKKILLKCILVLIMTVLIMQSFPIFVLANSTYNQKTISAQKIRNNGINNFPQSYQVELKKLVERNGYTNWKFKAFYTDIDWNELVSDETTHLKNTIIKDGSYPESWYCECNSEGDKDYYCASKDIVSYYLDPRNFITKVTIFQFLDLSNGGNISTSKIESLVKNTFLDGKTDTGIRYAQAIKDAANESGESPYSIVIKIFQELGKTKDKPSVITGKDEEYPGVYNFYNYGASDGKENIKNALKYAQNAGWNNEYKAIVEGAKLLSSSYLKSGQNTKYLQKFDVVGTLKKDLYNNQYMTNVQDPNNQSSMLYDAYEDYMNDDLTFIIPVYKNMPTYVKLPSSQSGNLYYVSSNYTGVYLRTGPGGIGSGYSNIKSLPKDTIVNVLETGINGWAKIETDDEIIGYISEQYITKVNAIKDTYMVPSDTELPFEDVDSNSWYYSAIKYNYNARIMSGTSESTFEPETKVTRGMLVTILYNLEGHPSITGTSKFADVQNKNVYFYNAVVWASNNNVVSGYANGKFGPDDNITREQLATILYNYCRYKGKYKTVYADYSKYTDSNKISSFAKWGMNWAVGHKIVNGSNGKLNPQGTATRAEAAAMISNYCNTIK